jgi:hypothetical protein
VIQELFLRPRGPARFDASALRNELAAATPGALATPRGFSIFADPEARIEAERSISCDADYYFPAAGLVDIQEEQIYVQKAGDPLIDAAIARFVRGVAGRQEIVLTAERDRVVGLEEAVAPF